MKAVQNFSGGEASPEIKGRTDVTQYYSLAETLENCIVTHFGGVFKTPGTIFVKRVKAIEKETRLIPFIFSQGDAYILEFGDEYIRFFTDSGSLVESALDISGITNADPCVVTCNTHGLTDGDYIEIDNILGTTQLNGRRFIIANKTSNTFELQDENGVDIDSTNYGIYVSGGTAQRVYEITAPYSHTDLELLKFTQQADIVYISHPSYAPRKLSRLGATSWTIAEIGFNSLDWAPFLSINTTATTLACSATTGDDKTLTASASLFTSNHVGAYFQLQNGYVKITAVGSATSATCNVISTLDSTDATDDWYEGAWSDAQGYPKDCKFYEQRLYFVSTTFKPLTVWGSEVGNYENYKVGTDDSDPVSFTLGSSQLDAIQWIYPANGLVLGTGAGPFIMSSGSSGESITPTSVFAKLQNENGVSSVSPIRIGPFVCYVEGSGEQLGQFSYSLDYDSFETENLSYLCDHILKSGVKYMSLQKYPYNIVWLVLNNGSLVTMTRDIKNQVKGFTRQVFPGDALVESVAVIPNGSEDQVWIVVKRYINGVWEKYVEYFSAHSFLQDTANFMQSSIIYSGFLRSSFTNLYHLEGATVQVLVDGAVHPDVTVTNGSVILNWEGQNVIIGLGYTTTIKTMDLEMGDGKTGRMTHISEVMVRFHKTLGCKVGDGVTMDIIPFRAWGDNFNEATQLFTGDKIVEFPSGHNTNKYIVVTQEQPLPLRILGLFPKGVMTGR
jgi:hypothetical protein